EGSGVEVLKVVLVEEVAPVDRELPRSPAQSGPRTQELDRIHNRDVGRIPVLFAAVLVVDADRRFVTVERPFLLRADVELRRHGLRRLVADCGRHAEVRIEGADIGVEEADFEVCRPARRQYSLRLDLGTLQLDAAEVRYALCAARREVNKEELVVGIARDERRDVERHALVEPGRLVAHLETPQEFRLEGLELPNAIETTGAEARRVG